MLFTNRLGGNLLQELEFLAQVLLAAGGVATTSLRQERLAVVLPQPRSERLEGSVDAVLDALGVGAGVVAVKVRVHVHDKVVLGAVGVRDFVKCRCGARRDKGLCAGVALAGKQNEVVLGACVTDRGHSGLDSGGPASNVGDVL